MQKLNLMLVAAGMVFVLGSVAQSWPSMGSAPIYQCCCENNCGRGGCFICRNPEYSCNCQRCSCYDEAPTDRATAARDFMSMLYRSGFGGGRVRRQAVLEDDAHISSR